MKRGTAGKPNITIIVLDTLRYDAFTRMFGRSGGLDDFVILEKCIAPASWTLPSHASLFTGMYPSEHGAHETRSIKSLDIERIKLRKGTFVGDLNGRGYSTYAISANPYISPVYGFDEFKSFEEESYFTDVFGSTIEVANRLKPMVSKYRNVYGSSITRLSAAVLHDDPKLFLNLIITALVYSPVAVIKKAKAKFIDGWPIEKGGKRIVERVRSIKFKKPFFLFINIMEPHDPYVGSKDKENDVDMTTSFLKKEPTKELIAKWKRLYNLASQKGYGYALDIIKSLRERFGENQLIILTSDHGQCIGEHNFIGHGTLLYDELVHVPFAVLLPEGMRSTHVKDSYTSLVGVRAFVSAVLSGDRNPIEELYSSNVYSESFGVPTNITMVRNIDLKKVRKFEKYSRRTFH